jgi:predicted nucleic acid-binding protein
MSGDNILADTNLIIHLLNGNAVAREVLEGKSIWLSCITEMEVLSYPRLSEKEVRLIKEFFAECIIVELGGEVKETAIAVRSGYGLKLPDAIIAATAIYLDFPLLTMDSDFNRVKELNCVVLKA